MHGAAIKIKKKLAQYITGAESFPLLRLASSTKNRCYIIIIYTVVKHEIDPISIRVLKRINIFQKYAQGYILSRRYWYLFIPDRNTSF